jgi:hypothetical protein
MAEEVQQPSTELTIDDRFKRIEALDKKDKVNKQEDFIKQLVTRDKLERDFKEDKIYVTFNSSFETRRTVLARRPTQKEFIDILSLSIQAANFEGKGDTESLLKLSEIYGDLPKIAANLCVDKNLNEDFWTNCVSFITLQNFISELVTASQKPLGGLTEEDMKSFRGE